MTPAPDPQALWAQLTLFPQLVVITGEIGAGKTSWCAALARWAQMQGARVSGLLSVGVFEGSLKRAIDLQDLSTGQTRRLAARRAQPDPTSPTPNWEFDESALRWGDAVLAAAPPCDLLIVDELGPLELLHGAGYQSAFPLIQRQAYRLACVVVRPSLVDAFRARAAVSAVYSVG